jgi:hypothetical protein
MPAGIAAIWPVTSAWRIVVSAWSRRLVRVREVSASTGMRENFGFVPADAPAAGLRDTAIAPGG